MDVDDTQESEPTITCRRVILPLGPLARERVNTLAELVDRKIDLLHILDTGRDRNGLRIQYDAALMVLMLNALDAEIGKAYLETCPEFRVYLEHKR